ncbi:MAG: SLBB domain-containing protein [Prevotella sp.]|nr:SLBB domain-containing protein [Prevotella sp.]
MKRYILFLLIAMCSMGVYAQSRMSDNQVMEFIVKEHKKGTSQGQIVTKLMQSGVDINQIRRVKKMYERMQSSTSMDPTSSTSSTDDRSRSNNVKDDDNEKAAANSNYRVAKMREEYSNTYDENDEEFMTMQQEMDDWMPTDTIAMFKQLQKELEKNKKKVFGRDIFNKKNLTFEPNMNIATPRNYVLGPGDAVYIDIYGASQKTVSATVSPDGYITIEGFGPIHVSGLTISQANSRIKSNLGARYSSSKIQLSLGQTRTITVNVMGEVKKPGTYTLSAFASVFHALYMAGGPNDLGTLRNVKVYRDNHLVTTVDVYDYILNGKLTGNIKLTDNDVIAVGPYDCLVNITGKVKRPMYYEMKKSESVGTLIRYAGGFAGDAYTQSVRVVRKNGRLYSVYNVNEFDMSSFHVADDDSVSVDSIIPRFENMVQIKGAVFRPGMYQVGDDINSVRTLIEAADGLTEFAFTNRAVMHRMKPTRTLEVIPVDVKGIMDGTIADIPLQNEDVLFIPSIEETETDKTLTIYGEVRYPGTYKYADNETLEDFVLQAGGLKETASTVKVDVSRRIVKQDALTTDSILAQTFNFALKEGFVVDGEPGFVLQPYDEVYVHRSPGYNKQGSVTVNGEIMFAGNYALAKRNTRLSDVIKMAGGPNDMAYVKGARLERKANDDEKKRMEDIFKMAREQQQKNLMELAANSQNANVLQVAQQNQGMALEKFYVPDYYPVGIDLDKALANPGCDDDIILREGDRITIPQYNGTVKINGAVMHSTTVAYVKGKSVDYYIDQAGGFASDAKKSRTYILYMNGKGARVGHNAKVRPGSEIFVPTKAQAKMSVAEKLAVGTGVTSIATMIATLANVLK